MAQRIMKWLHVFVVLILLNILWLLGTIVGVFFLGLVPSTQAIVYLIIQETIFDPYTSYLAIIKIFVSQYLKNLKRYHIKSIIIPLGIVLLYIDFHIINVNFYLQALLQIPLLLTTLLGIIVFLTWLIADIYTKDSVSRTWKFALLTPLVLPFQTFLCVVLSLAFIVISLKWSWFHFLGFSTLIISITKIFNETMLRKGLIKIEG